MLSLALVRELLALPSLHRFLEHATGPDGRNINRHGETAVSEDILLGFWLGRLQALRQINVTYVNSNSARLARIHNVQCGVGEHFMNQRVSNERIVLAHLLKSAESIEYVGSVLQRCAPHDEATCLAAGINK